uniref:Dystonin n=1 Tax=Sinocyclocheilus anshuiensis TaxID=1608454 RepID=A0A671KRR7_9TELE
MSMLEMILEQSESISNINPSCFSDERDRVQKKTFTKWINQHLLKVRKHVNDLYEDLRDGHNLISLLEVLSGETLPRERDFLKTLRLPREKGRMRFHRLQNVQIALDFLKRRQVKLVNIRNDDITDGNPKLTLGLIWTIILHFQISDIHVTGESEDMTAKERLLLWSKQMTEGYVGVRCDNFTTSWRDGRLFNAIIHKYRPDLVDMSKVSTQSSRSNLEQAFGVAEQLGVARLLDPEDVDLSSPDEKSVITYVSTLYDVFPKVPEGMEGISANDVDIKWVEYQNMVKYLSQWIKHNVTVMSDRNFPSNPVELKALYTQYLQFKENEIPPKENEKAKIKHLYKMLEVWIEFGRIQLPQGYHPNDVEKEWGKLIVAMLEREKSLRPEVDRLEMLQQIANRVQRDCVAGEDKLALARTALQSDAKRLESGIQFQNEAETAGYLLECENLLRQQVVDIQLLLDGKFYLADQLVQRVSKLRDDLLALRTECSTVYSKGRTLTSEQTKMMISGITQSLNSNFSPNFSAGLSPALTHGGLVTSGGSPAMSPAMTPSMQPAVVQTYLSSRGGGGGGGGGGGTEPGVLQQLKHMQIRKPMLKSSFLDPNLTEDEVHMKFVQDLLIWVEEMQVQLDQAEWGSDLPSVESNLGNHKDFHKAIEEFQMSIKEAKMSEIQMTQPLKQSYSEKLNKLESQYRRLLRQKHLDSLYDFVSRATQELIWLNEKEEEEVAFDWSERNSNISRKRDYHADLMRELDDKEEVIKSVQEKAESLLLENHPARLTIEAYRAAMQTQWSWILQLCHCVEQHLKENAVYFDFFSDAKESLDYLKSLQDAIHRKYSCDRSSSLHRLEDLIQESMDEKEQLLKYSSTVGGLVGRAKSVVQLKARNPENPIRTSLPVKSICDYRQIEITISKEDECVLVSNSHRAKWKVISPSGNEAMVPSVCFSVPPPNREATEMASRIEQLYQNALALWHHSHINMSSLQSLQSHFLRDSDESEVFTVADCAQLDQLELACKEYYEELLKSAEREEHEESVYNLFISEVRNFRMRVEGHEEQLIRKIRTPLDRDDLQECVLRITEQEKKKVELDRLKDDLECLREKCDVFLRQAAASPSVPTLSSELNILTQSTNQVYSMCCIYLEKLKTVSLVVKHSQSAEALVKLYEAKLCEEDTINANIKSIDGVMSTLKQWRSEIDERREVFHDLEDELQKARVISERMFKTHNERDFDLDWHKEKADQLKERWQNIHSQIENRLRDLEGISKSLKYYKDTYNSLDEWSKEMEAKQLKAQENQPEDSKALAEFLNQQKVLVTEIEQKQSKIEECQKYSEQYAVGVKDYELQLMTYRAMVDSQHKSPVKRRKMQSSSDVIQQEFMDLRTRYTALVTLMTQYVKFAGETLKRAEEDEVGHLLTYSLTLHPVVLISIRIVGEMLLLHAGHIDKRTYLFLSQQESEWQEITIMDSSRNLLHILTDPKSGRQLCIENALSLKILQMEELNSYRSGQLSISELADLLISRRVVFKVIQGILDVESGAVMSVCYSVNNGFIDQNTGLGLLEAQLITTGLIWPEQHLYMDLEEAFKNKLVDDAMRKQLQDLNETKKCLQDLQFALEPLPVMAALENGAISEQTAMKVIEIQLATGGLRLTYTGDILHLEGAFQLGLIPQSLFIQILERKDTWKNLIDPNTAEKVTLSQLVQRSMVHEPTGLRLLPVKRGKDGTISLTSGREINIMKAMHEGVIDRETMFRLLSTQLFAGGIVDTKTGRKLTVEEALSEGLIDQDTASEILSHQAQNGGIVNPCNGARLTVDEAVQCDLISSSSALLVLERQKAFMGLLWPNAGEILLFSTSLQQNIITDKLASELLRNRHKITALYIPETSEVVDIDSAGENNLIETFTKELLKMIEIPDVVPDIDELNNRFSSWLVMRELQIDGSCSSGEEISDENSSDGPSPSEAKQLFISYLIMNSYMDPKSGQRLLIFDWQLNKMAKLLFETSESDVDEISGLFMNVSEEPPLNNSIPDNANASLNVDYGALGELQICESLESTTEEDAKSPMETATEVDLSTDDQSKLAHEKVHASYEVEYANNVSEDLDHEHSDEDSGAFSSENRVLEMVKYEDMSEMFRNAPKTKPEHRVVCTESSIDCKVEESDDIEDSVGFKGSEDTCQLSLIDLAGSTVNSKQLPLEIVTNSSQVDSSGGNHNIQHPSEQGIFCNHVAPKATTKDELARSSESDFTSHNDKRVKDVVEMLESSSGQSSEDMFAESNELQSARQIPSPSVKIMLDQNSEQSADIFNQSQAGDTVVAEDVHQDDLHLPYIAMAEDESLPKSMGSRDLKYFLNALIQMKKDGASMEKTQKQKCQAIDTQIAALPDLLTADLSVAEQLLNSADELIPMQIHQDLAAVNVDLQNAFTDVCHLSAERSNAILLAVDTVKLDFMDADNIERTKNKVQQNKVKKDLSGTRQLLEDAAFDIQNFISGHAQFLSPTRSRYLLRALSATQRSYKELMDRAFTQRQTLEVQLEIREEENQQKALQKDLQANASALNEVISSTKKFLEENRSKLTPEQISALENKLEELKSKVNTLNQRAEESRKDLEKVLTSAIKQETETVVAVEQLEESKTKIEGLLDWISNVGKEKEMGGIQKDQMVKQNGNMPENTSVKRIIGEEDDPNGNALDTTDNTSLRTGEKQDGKNLDLDQQFNRVQAHHQEILSQQQNLIIATQSAQALLDKQAQVLSPAEKDKLQRDIKELEGRYKASLTQAEQQMKQVQTVQEELQKFKGDCEEFETWLQQATGEMEELGAPAAALDTLSNNLQRQKSFSEDVISHKGDLRFITISGQKVLDAAKACDCSESGGAGGLPVVEMSGTCAAVKERLDSAASRYKCNQLGNNLKDVVDKYKKYEDASGALVKWLNVSEEESRRQQSEPIAGDPQTLQRQLEETKNLQGQTTSHQAAVDSLRKTADALISTEGDLLSHPEEIQETVDDIIERYDNLSKSVSDRNEKLQVTLTRSLSVQDGLDEMMSWMEKVEESVKETPKVPLDSSSIADALSKEAALEQDMSSRQSSILAMKAKVKKFVESAEPAAAILLQAKMEGLSQRFTDASERHKQKVAQMEELRDKVEQFEKTSEKVQQFVLKSSQVLSETDGPGKNVAELFQLVQVCCSLTKRDCTVPKPSELHILIGVLWLWFMSVSFEMSNYLIKLYMHMRRVYCRKEEVSSCQKQLQEFKAATGVLMKWLEETKEQVPVLQPNCSEQGLGTDLQKVNVSDGLNFSPLIHILYLPLELMLVQQNMSYINNNYEHLGELLKARSSELGALLKRVLGVHDQAESLRQWMEDTKKTATSLSNHPSGKDTVKSQIEQQKVFEDNMKQKQVQLQQLRENLLRLIEEHPDSPEAEQWKHMLAQIDAGWEEVRGTMEIRKQHLEESSRMLELFQTTQPQLSQWLQEKELMMGVLGPLSVDPNMLNTQKQQVQILLKEFDSRKPQYEKLTEAATAIASASEQQDPAVEQVKEQLASVSQKWQVLTGQLSQRHALIEQAVGKTTQFQELLQSLSKSATCLETELNNQQALSTQPDEVKKQIEATNTILAQLREEKKRLKEAETVCSELSAMVTEEYLRADLTKQLEGITKPFRQLEDKAGIVQLNSAFASSQQFHQTSKDFQAWLNQTLQEQCKPQPISANAEKLKQSLKENSASQKAISEHEEPYNTIIKEGEALLQSTEGAEKVALQGQLSALKSSWDDVKKGNAEQAEKLQGALERALKYKEHYEKLSSWLQEVEDREKYVKLSVNSVEIEGSLSQLKAIQKDVEKHRGQVVMMNAAADSLLEVVTSDGDSVREEKAAIGKKVDKLTEDLTLKKESLENISQKLKEFNDLQKEAKGQLETARKQLDSHSALGVQAYSNKNLTNMKAQQNSLEGVHNQIEHLKNVAKSLVVDASEVEGVTDLLLQADSLEKDHMSITRKVEDACSTLEDKLQGIGQFQDSIREMFANFTDLDDEFDGMAPVGRDLDTLGDQQSTIKDFIARLQDLMTNTANGRDSCKKMLESEASLDLLGLKRDLETLGKQCGKLMDRATGRREQVEETFSHLEEFYDKAQEFTHRLSSAEKQEESQGSVGLETEVINQQLESFKVFQKDVIESLQSQLQELNTLGQALIQNAAKGTSTKKLDHDLEEVNTRWNTLNKKVAERSAQLHEALLHCGRFQDALESLLSWLTDTEELVANQKPPSAEFKVVKAQIQEQKLLQRLLDDRRATVELIKTEGRKVTDLADTVDKEKIAREIECLGQRWDALLKKAENRQKQLENILVVAQQFHETLVPLTEWLTATEKRLANSEPIGTQTSKIEEQISQHKALEEEVLGRGKILYQTMSLGQSLRAVSCADDKELVQAKLDNTHSSYIELQEHCRQKAELLRQALANAQLFGEDEVALMTWLDEVHGKLSEVSIQDYTTAVLSKQHAEQLALHEDIELRKQNIEQAVLNGLELLKQTTGDEVVVIQGKLDGIKTRYSEINTMSNNVSKTLDKALSLATKLQNTHEELNSWLEKVESELATFTAQEPVGEQLTHLQERQKTLMKEVKDQKPLVDSLNEVSSALLELVPWRAREGLDRMVTDDNERYRTASDAITQHVDQTGAAILKSQQFEQAATTELEWLTEAERKLSCLGDVRLEPEQTTAQLQAQKSFSMDIMRHKDAVDAIVKTSEVIMNSKDEAEKQMKLQTLSEKYSVVSQLNSERCLQLERAHSLASQFWETYDELWPWLQETRTTFTQLSQPAIEYEALRQQQEELRQMRELIAEHKPHIDKMNKTGPQLVELSPTEGLPIREKYETAEKLYSQLKVDVKHRAAALDEAISKSTQFHDKIDPMLESLERIAERLRQPPSISVEVEKIREQISENKAVNVDLEKLQPSYETLMQRGEEMIARSEGADKDLSAKAVQDKLDQMVFLWNDIQALLEEREAKLLDVMDLAEKFWCDHCALIVTIKDTHDLLKELEEPGVDPSVVKQQQESVEGFREEIDGLQEELNVVQNLGAELMTACGEPDKPVIKKSIDEVNSAWEILNKAWKERVETLEEAMQAAVQFQDSLQSMFDSVDIMEGKLDLMSPVGTDLETVKQQIEELKEFKGDAYQLQIEMERLNHQTGLLLKKVVEEADRNSILEPMNELKMLWDNLDKKIINRQHKLEGALLALGQFQHALDELLAWLTHTEELLNEQRKACGDPKAIEIELAKHHVLQNDVLAHKTTVEAVNKAGSDLIDSSAGEEARGLQNKLENLNQRWRTILEKTEQRRQFLDSALLQAQGFHGEIEDMQRWLKDTERQLLASKALGGLPDTAREQLNTHLELCSTLEAKEEIYKQLLDRGQQILALTPEGQDSTTELDLRNLQEKWECVQAKVTERKVKLEEALAMATDFHNSLQDFINWLTQAEQTLTMVSPASLILETVMFQIDEHKVFVTEVNSHRDQIIELDKTGTHLKYFSQKQDVVLIKNLLLSVQGRWEKVVQRSVERGRLLDDARKRAKQFHETWNKLMEWLEESERALDSELEIANDPDKIKMQLSQHKEFQKTLGSKHSVCDTTSRTGRALKDKTSLQDDNQKLDDMLSELRDKWDTVCGKSVERQNKLEEALLFSGQFTDALQALIDWLYKVEPQLAEDQPVHGDIDLVLNLIDSHKGFQKELGKRTGSVQALKHSARELIESSHDDSSWVKVQMQELSTRWETVCSLSVSKQTRLEQALCQAEEFHSTVHILLEWLAEAEQSLRFHGALPDDEEALRALIEQHKEFMKKLEEKRLALNKATSMGEAILSICHPDSITTIKHWNTIIKARFEEVTAWARQHQQRLSSALAELLATQELLENLLNWLKWAETTLGEKDKEPLPQELEEVKSLIAEHQTFMEEMTRNQPDVDKITKTHKRKATADPPVQSQIPILGKGRTRSPTQSMYTAASQAQIETKNPRVNLLVSKWQQVWLLALDRRRKLNDALDRLEELKEFANFDFDVWRKRYMRWMNHKKSRVMDFFRRIDKDQDGKVTRQEFIDGILSSKFPTSRLEMSAVADIFDRDGDGYIDYYEFVAALHPNKDAYKPLTDADKIEDEVTRQVAKCKCPKRFQVEQIGANKYRFYLGNQFGDSQQLRLVRILRSTVMVRVGGGWMALDEFLVKNDPCRAKGRTNLELREKFILPEGTTQVMASFRYRGRRSRPSSRGASPNRSNSSYSCPAQPNPPGSSTPKTPQHLTRNYDKPWLTNSKSATPLKSSDSFDSQGSSNESTPIQGSKLRLPGYLSGKGFQSGEDGTLINAAVMKARGQAMGDKIPSRPGSKAGSRGSSRRGSDASDFDISDIQSVCSDVSETVTDSGRPMPRSASRQHGGKHSKIPTPQRRSTPTSKLAKNTKR